SSVLGESALCIGSTLEVMFFSLALAERIAQLRQEKLEAVERAVAAERGRADVLARSEQALKKLVAEREQALRSKEQADVANRAKSRFLATASHDLRQPIQAMRLFLNIMGKLGDPQEIKPLIGHMEHSVQSLSELLDTFLDISKLDSGAILPDWQPVSIGALIERLVSEFEVQALDAGLRLKIWQPARDVVVWSDPNLLLMVMRNLVSNAIRYTRQGGLLIACRRRGGQVSLQVWDSGIGIPPAEQQQVFEEFFQAGNAASGRGRGVGLGLSIVDRLARLLKSGLALRSRPGKGSCFEITLPVSTQNAPARVAVAVDGHEGSGTKHHIAVIDDDPQVLLALQLYLQSMGYGVIAAVSGADAIRLFHSHEWVPDMVISDYGLGDAGNGCQAVAELRQAFGKHLPALIVTGEIDGGVIRHIEAEGLAFLRKPINPVVLTAQVGRLLQAGEAEMPSGMAGSGGLAAAAT
ncbi:MAG TPA: hybrid sensor histidine kinase/response regulator, partial [Azospira sp.]|nr:hybrid sensor histidine kinase/response regulator [Azospira sp.]